MFSTTRKVGRHHLAFYRGWLQGLDLKTLADQYLETGLDLRLTKATLSWLRDTLSQAALRHGRYQEARLLRLYLKPRANEQTLAFPSLEAFQEEVDPEGEYSEEELIRWYFETFPQALDRKIRQRRRLMERQLAALSWIEPLLAAEPVPEDVVSAWFDPKLAERLILAGLPTLGALMQRIKARGYRFWVTVPRLGEKGALRIVSWLRGYEASLGPLPEYALAPRHCLKGERLIQSRPPQTAIVPLEAFVLPKALTGKTGSNRHPGPARIQAADDLQAIETWLTVKSASPHTFRAYRKEAERLLLWAVLERQKALSDLSVEDCAAYRDFLSALGRAEPENWPYRLPQAAWLGKRNTPRFSPNWRPFDGPLSFASVRQGLIIVSSLFEWLVRVQYLSFNPFDAVSTKLADTRPTPQELELTRVFSPGQWEFLMAFLKSLPEDAASARLRFILPFAYSSGLRLRELVEARIEHLYSMPLRQGLGVRWMLKVRGKGGRWRAVPLSSRAVECLCRYLAYRGLNPDPLANPPQTPLIARLDGQTPLSASALYKALKALFEQVAERLEKENQAEAAKSFRRATTHWLRHTCGAHLASNGVPVNLVQKLLGHASLATTSLYTKVDEEQLWTEIEKRQAV